MAEKEYIERGALLQRISLQANRTSLGEISEPYMTWKDVLAEIMCSPVADVAPVVHAEWDENKYPFCNVCTDCGLIIDRTCIKRNSGKLNLCLNCGAKIDGKEAAP